MVPNEVTRRNLSMYYSTILNTDAISKHTFKDNQALEINEPITRPKSKNKHFCLLK